MEIILMSNGPGELYTWARPVLQALREKDPSLKVGICLIPDQFTSGAEAEIAKTFGADVVTDSKAFMAFLSRGRPLPGIGETKGAVISLGGSTQMALRLAASLGYPTYRYSFVPYWNRKLHKLFVHDEAAKRKARRLGAPKDKLECIGNLVADAVEQTTPAKILGRPHILLMPGSRDSFSLLLIPFMIAVAEHLAEYFPDAHFVWPLSRLLKEETVVAGIAGREKDYLGGMAGTRSGDYVLTPKGRRIRIIKEEERHAHMRAADCAVTIPGTNTLELGIAGVPSVVILPMNKPEVIPLEGIGHWLGLIPVIGKPIKRRAVKLFVEGLKVPVSLPNRFSGEDLMLEVKGIVNPLSIAQQVKQLLDDEEDLARRKAGLNTLMPKPGAAKRLVESVVASL